MTLKSRVKVCLGTACLSAGARKVKETLEKELGGEVGVDFSGCHGFCSQGPLVVVDDYFYTNVDEKTAIKIAREHIINGKPLQKYFYKEPLSGRPIEKHEDIPFYKKQTRILLEYCGKINPESIEDYEEIGGYQGLRNALKKTPEEVIELIKASGLRGRGGAGFPTGKKWELTRKAKGNKKFVIINADEGDPGAFMDGALLEANPHSVLEGLIIGGYAIGAENGIIYIRAEYPLAVKRFRKAIEDAREKGYLGKNILRSGFNFDVTIYEGAGAFVCGEETAMIKSIEGERGQPVPKPPFPATSGLWGYPTNINNVKTWAFVSWILKNGVEKFRKYGTERSPGTALFSLTGKVKNTGLVEVPMGTTLREIIFDIGGGIERDKKFKAVQTGGPSGGCIPEILLDTPVEYETMAEVGSIMGSGGMVVIDEDTCIVDFAKFFLSFTQKESCGKCTPCREGTYQMLKILEKITHGEATMQDLENLEELAHVVQDTSLCGLGKTAPNPVLSTLKYFRDEYIEHIVDKKCRAHVCPGLFKLYIDQEACKKCGLCQDACNFDAIPGNKEEGFVILTDRCVGCKACILACPVDVIHYMD